jgi:hypothetical protein
MAELTELETKLAEVLGLARAAQTATEKVAGMVEDEEVANTLREMQAEAEETEQRCVDVAGELDGKKTAIDEKAQETRSEAEEMMKTYLEGESDGLDGLEFLIMAEAGELGHTEIVARMNENAGERHIAELVDWVLPVQQRHFEQTRQAALKLAAAEDPNATS